MPPTTDEIKAAAGRLRRLAAGEGAGTVYAGLEHLGSITSFYTRDNRTLADAWLAATAHDAEAITVEWMDAVGGDDERGDGVRVWRVGSAAKLCAGRGTAPGLWHCWVREGGFDEESVTLPLLTTRGQLRRLLAALGLPLPQGGGS